MEKTTRPTLVKTVLAMLRNNGVIWTAHVLPYIAVRKVWKNKQLGFLDRRIKAIEARKGVPGMNCAELNNLIWETWDWDSEEGEEWTEDAMWKQSVVDCILHKHIKPGGTVLEVGPGGGRWTEYLQPMAEQLYVVDIAQKAIDTCKRRFSQCQNIEYHVTPDSSLAFISDGTLDYVWSFDVFVHIAPEDIDGYLGEFSRTLSVGGVGVIHHAAAGGLKGGWRSSMTAMLFVELLEKHGLSLVEQFSTWGPKNEFDVHYYDDCVTVFSRNGNVV